MQETAERKAGNEEKTQAGQSRTEAQEKLDICEAVFRYQFEHNASGAQQKAKAYFLKIHNKDPSDEFLARFKGHTPPVKKGSDFAIRGATV